MVPLRVCYDQRRCRQVAADETARQGRTGQAGRQVGTAAGRRCSTPRPGGAASPRPACWPTGPRSSGPVLARALPAASRRACSRPAQRRHARAAGRRRRRARAAASGAAADRADQHLFRPSRHPADPPAADAAAAARAAPARGTRRAARRRPRLALWPVWPLADERPSARRCWPSAVRCAPRRDAARVPAPGPPYSSAARRLLAHGVARRWYGSAAGPLGCWSACLALRRLSGAPPTSASAVLGKPGAGHDHRVLLADLPALRRVPAKTLPELKKRYIDTGKVKLVLRDFPLDQVALKAAVIAHCAGDERYFAVHRAIFAGSASWARAKDPVAALKQLARLGGLGAGSGRRLPRRQGAWRTPCCRPARRRAEVRHQLDPNLHRQRQDRCRAARHRRRSRQAIDPLLMPTGRPARIEPSRCATRLIEVPALTTYCVAARCRSPNFASAASSRSAIRSSCCIEAGLTGMVGPERLRQVQHRRSVALGHGRKLGQGPARRRDGRRHLQRLGQPGRPTTWPRSACKLRGRAVGLAGFDDGRTRSRSRAGSAAAPARPTGSTAARPGRATSSCCSPTPGPAPAALPSSARARSASSSIPAPRAPPAARGSGRDRRPARPAARGRAAAGGDRGQPAARPPTCW